MKIDAQLIPTGKYCYSYTGEIGYSGIPITKRCPYWFSVAGMSICPVAQVVAIGNSDVEYDRALSHCGGDDGVLSTITDGSLIWDQVKECDINIDENDEHDCYGCGECAC